MAVRGDAKANDDFSGDTVPVMVLTREKKDK